MSLPGLFGTAIGQDAQGDGGGEGGDPSRLPVKDKDLTAPPGSPSVGDRYIVASVATGAWTGKEDDIAEWAGAAWTFETPIIGWITYVDDETEYYSWNGTAWVQESMGPHAPTHEDGGSDELSVEALATAGGANTVPKGDGSGGLAMGNVAHAETTGVTSDQHHAQIHSASHDDGAADEIVAENLATAGAAGTAPVSDGVGGLSMGAPTPATHAIGGSEHSASTPAAVNALVTGDNFQVESEKSAANGYASLDATAKVPTSELPASVLGDVAYQGVWNAATNTPTLASGVGTKGYFYKVSVAGSTNLDGITDWKIGDMPIFNGATWDKIDNTESVTSVHGRLGAVVAASGDYTHAQTSGQTADDHHNQQHALGGADHTTATLAQLNAKVSDATLIAAWDEAQVYYVGKHGNDSNDGKSINEAMLTITAAIARAVALTPSATNRFTIRVVDAGVYTESISVPAYVFLDAPNVKLIGTLTLSGSPAAADIDTAAPLANGIAVESIGAGDRFLKAKLLQVSGTGVTGAGIKVTFSGHLLVDVGHIDADGTCHGIWSDAGNVYGRVGRLDVEEGVAAYIKANNSDISVYVGSMEIRHASGKGIHITSLGGVASLVDLQIGRAGSLGTFIDLDAGSAHVYVGQVDGVTALYNLSGASNLYLFGGKLSGTRTSTTSGDEKVTEAGVAPLHAATHKDGGPDELDVEELASAGAADALATSDGAGAVAMVPHDPVKWYDAASLDSPDGTADVPGSMDAAPISADSVASNIPIRFMDDDAERGVLLQSTVHIPAGVVNMKLHSRSHPETAPGSAKNAVLVLYARKHNSGAARGSWGSGVTGLVPITTNVFDVFGTLTKTLAAWGLTAGAEYQILISRDPADGSDDLVDALELRQLGIEFY